MNREVNKKALQRLTGKTLLDAKIAQRLPHYKHHPTYHVRAKELQVCKRQRGTYQVIDVQIWLEKCRSWPGPVIYLQDEILFERSENICPLCRENIILYAQNLGLF